MITERESEVGGMDSDDPIGGWYQEEVVMLLARCCL